MFSRGSSSKRPPGFFGTLWRLSLVGGLLFAATAAAGYATVYHLVKTPELQAPELVGLPLEEAIERASALDLAVRLESRRSGAASLDKVVHSQRPRSGQWIKTGSIMYLTLDPAGVPSADF